MRSGFNLHPNGFNEAVRKIWLQTRQLGDESAQLPLHPDKDFTHGKMFVSAVSLAGMCPSKDITKTFNQWLITEQDPAVQR